MRTTEERGTGGHRWPLAIAIGLTLVVLVNLGFIWVAVSGADEVVPSYYEEAR